MTTGADGILLETVVTEKATALSSSVNQYTFKVHPSSNRLSVAHAVEKTFDVTVKGVNIINVKPKARRDRTRRGRFGFRGGYKKVVVSLLEGDSIEMI